MDQRSDDWYAVRAGKFTASRSSDLMAKTKTGPGASRGALVTLLAIERITGKCVETYSNAAMQRGIELEAEALDAYAFDACVVVNAEAFVEDKTLPNTGCSPDGVVDADGLVEVKCPSNPAKHLDALRSGAHAKEYAWQLQHQLMATGRKWVDAVSYDPRFPGPLQLAVVRVVRDEKAIAELRAEIRKADAEVQQIVDELNGRLLAKAA